MRVYVTAQALLTLTVVFATATIPAEALPQEDPRHAVTLFGGIQLDNPWADIYKRPEKLNITRGRFVGVAGSTRLLKPLEKLSIEFEAQAVRHVRGQHHWEFNAAPVVRWTPIQSNGIIDAGMAYGIGLSHTTEKPEIELDNEGETARTMIYWVFELAAGPANSPWEGVARVHHRSPAYGLFAADGGYNGLVLGTRRRF